MKRLLPFLSFVSFCPVPALHAETVCEPLARSLERLAETPNFILTDRGETIGGVDRRMVVTPEGVSSRYGTMEAEFEPQDSMMEAMRNDARRIRESEECVFLDEERLDDMPMLVFAPEGKAGDIRFWVGKEDGRVHRVTDEGELRFSYPDIVR